MMTIMIDKSWVDKKLVKLQNNIKIELCCRFNLHTLEYVVDISNII